jgi:23S rRNA pseudouridine1911/1915/1917 synthase
VVVEFAAEGDEVGARVDVVFARRAGATRARVQQALRAGAITVDGRPVAPSHRLAAGERVRGEPAPAPDLSPRPERMALAVRYSDERVLVISKPAGLVTHPARGHAGGTLVNALLALGEPLAARASARPGLVHRLDKDTSGLLLVAKDDDALSFLQTSLRARRVERRYLALVRGRPGVPSGSVDAPLGRDPGRPTLRAVVPGGKPAVTHYRVRAAGEGLALLDVRLDTGRTHQIRIHLAHIGHPVLGDRPYGGATEAASALGLRRPFLHACVLSWPDPARPEDVVTVRDGLPPELQEALARAGLDARLEAPGVGRTVAHR